MSKELDAYLAERASVLAEDLTYTIRRDGNAWLATRSDFVDLQESISGYGDTPLQAMLDLYVHELTAAKSSGGGDGGGTGPLCASDIGAAGGALVQHIGAAGGALDKQRCVLRSGTK